MLSDRRTPSVPTPRRGAVPGRPRPLVSDLAERSTGRGPLPLGRDFPGSSVHLFFHFSPRDRVGWWVTKPPTLLARVESLSGAGTREESGSHSEKDLP